MDFDWDDANLEHIARHGVDDLEAEDALTDEGRVRFNNSVTPQGEARSAFLGETEAGRILFVVVTFRNGRVRVVTVRDATDNEKRAYRSR